MVNGAPVNSVNYIRERKESKSPVFHSQPKCRSHCNISAILEVHLTGHIETFFRAASHCAEIFSDISSLRKRGFWITVNMWDITSICFLPAGRLYSIIPAWRKAESSIVKLPWSCDLKYHTFATLWPIFRIPVSSFQHLYPMNILLVGCRSYYPGW